MRVIVWVWVHYIYIYVHKHDLFMYASFESTFVKWYEGWYQIPGLLIWRKCLMSLSEWHWLRLNLFDPVGLIDTPVAGLRNLWQPSTQTNYHLAEAGQMGVQCYWLHCWPDDIQDITDTDMEDIIKSFRNWSVITIVMNLTMSIDNSWIWSVDTCTSSMFIDDRISAVVIYLIFLF